MFQLLTLMLYLQSVNQSIGLLSELIQKAKELADTDTEMQRVRLFERGVWEYMVSGREQWMSKLPVILV